MQPEPEVDGINFRKLFSSTTTMLIRRFGTKHWDAIEDAVQTALIEATAVWPRDIPQNPGAWLYRVAHRRFIDELRRDKVAARAYSVVAKDDHQPESELPDEVIRDNTLRMLFLCCSSVLKPEASIGLALKTVGGFGTSEIASAFLTTSETIKKRLQRARQLLASANFDTELRPEDLTPERVQAVRHVIYLIFNEGYFSSDDNVAIRDDLCAEAIRLISLLVHDPRTASPDTHALCSLLMFHAARHSERRSADGIPLRLADQNRANWDNELIRIGKKHLQTARAALGSTSSHQITMSPTLIEATIASHHCEAAGFDATNWTAIVDLYGQLIELRPWPQVRLALHIARSFAIGPNTVIPDLVQLSQDNPEVTDANYYAALADCYARNDQPELAHTAFEKSIARAEATWQREWIQKLAEQAAIDEQRK